MVTLQYLDFPKLRDYYKTHVWVKYTAPDFKIWVRDEFNCTLMHDHDPGSFRDRVPGAWRLEFVNDDDATAFVLKWG